MDFQQLSCASHLPAAQGAVLKDVDLVRWLQNKLQDREKWAGRECMQLVSREMIEELRTCFSMLENPTRLKVILSFLYLSPKHSKTWKESLEGLLTNARRDADDWVEIISELFRDVPMAKGTNTMTDEVQSYQKMIEDLKAIAQEHEDAGDLRADPPSMDICTSEIIAGLFEKEAPPQKHFALRKKPKSDALLAEMKKQCEILNSQKKDRKEAITSGCLPIKIRSTRREADNTLPMRGIPNQNQVKMSQGFTYEPKKFPRPAVKREGGAKMLDISDLPLSLKQRAKAEKEDEQRRMKEEKELQKKAKEEAKKAEAEAKRLAAIKAKEDAARSLEEKKQQMEKLAKGSKTEPLRLPVDKDMKPAGGLKRLSAHFNSPPPSKVTLRDSSGSQQSSNQVLNQSRNQTMDDQIRQPIQQQVPIQQPLHHQRPVQTFQIQQSMQQHQVPQIQQIQMQPQQFNQNQPRVIVQSLVGNQIVQFPGPSQIQQSQQHYIVTPTQQNPTAVDLFQDGEVARKCQEILTAANALDERGRNLVISFMKGLLRTSGPLNNAEHIMTLKLSENVEDGLVDGRIQKLKVEVFFQMDLSNGEWKRLRKCRLLEGDELNAFINQQQQQQQAQQQVAWNNQPYIQRY